jgi:hypothetical protein
VLVTFCLQFSGTKLTDLDCSNGGRRIYIETLLPLLIDGQDASSHPCVKGWANNGTTFGSPENYYSRELCWYMLNWMNGNVTQNSTTVDSTRAAGQNVQLALPFDCLGDATGVYS